MKIILIPVIAIFLMSSCSEKSNQESTPSTTQTTEIMQKEEKQQIEKLLNEYKKSLNTSDAKLAQSLYTKD